MTERDRKDIEDIKRLFILLLVKLGSTSDEIGAALGVHDSAVRKLFPTKKVKRIVLPAPQE
jgi:hypothetical protein